MEPMDKTGQWLQETSKPIRPLTNKEATALSTVKKTPNSIFKWAANTKNRRKETHLPTLFERREDTDFVQEQYQACLRDFNTLSNVSSFTQTTQSDNYDKIAEVTDDSDSITSQKPLHKIWQKNVVFVPEVIPCHITGICMLPEGSLTIVDQENFRVKQFDPHLNYVSYHKVFEHPWDVCPVEHSDMAIGVFQSNVRQEIHVMSGDRVFVCDSYTHAILEVDRQGKHVLGTVGSAVDPRAIWFDERNNRLLVGQKKDNVLIISLQ
ncbi:uncharacterized protein LOC128208558 [Mya arenaria]|uniref:uncharacterized protein LOC128208558 n=1 Tax=Mya arenaria TaxID=6604 RepID=UPI0022E8F89B|nr:uncharacterized protein LOC128208558 [Mya arenaria]